MSTLSEALYSCLVVWSVAHGQSCPKPWLGLCIAYRIVWASHKQTEYFLEIDEISYN